MFMPIPPPWSVRWPRMPNHIATTCVRCIVIVSLLRRAGKWCASLPIPMHSSPAPAISKHSRMQFARRPSRDTHPMSISTVHKSRWVCAEGICVLSPTWRGWNSPRRPPLSRLCSSHSSALPNSALPNSALPNSALPNQVSHIDRPWTNLSIMNGCGEQAAVIRR